MSKRGEEEEEKNNMFFTLGIKLPFYPQTIAMCRARDQMDGKKIYNITLGEKLANYKSSGG